MGMKTGDATKKVQQCLYNNDLQCMKMKNAARLEIVL